MDVLSLIGRKKNLFDKDIVTFDDELNNIVAENRFLIIGGAGSIGQAVTIEIFKRNPKTLHVVDISENNLVGTYKQIIKEISSYDKKLGEKKEIIFFNKSDLLSDADVKKKLNEFKNKIKSKYEVISVFSNKDIQNTKKTLMKYASR